jgi:uncharacterized membrane protein YdbT with pleckstrin-like domain
MIGGIGASIVVFAVGAILDFALTTSQYQHGFNVKTIGVILMIVGAVGFAVSVIAWTMWRGGGGPRRHSTVVDDGQGNVVRRDDTYV